MNREQALGYAQTSLKAAVELQQKAMEGHDPEGGLDYLDVAVKWSHVVVALRAMCS